MRRRRQPLSLPLGSRASNSVLRAEFDAAFDRGFITVADDGAVLVSPILSADDRQALSVHDGLRLLSLADGHRHYLKWHRV